jgi:hypothetical protein
MVYNGLWFQLGVHIFCCWLGFPTNLAFVNILMYMKFHVGRVEDGIDGAIGAILSGMVDIDVIPCKDIIEES